MGVKRWKGIWYHGRLFIPIVDFTIAFGERWYLANKAFGKSPSCCCSERRDPRQMRVGSDDTTTAIKLPQMWLCFYLLGLLTFSLTFLFIPYLFS